MKAGQIPVTFSYKNGRAGTLWMRQNEPRFGEELEPARVANMLGLSPADIDRRFPAMEVSTGLPFVIVPLKDMTSLKRARLDVEGFRRLVGRSRPESRRAEGVLVFSPETYHEKNDLNVRVLVPGLGVVIEDPATGSANGCLAAYLARNRYSASQEVDARVEQGYEIGRKSLLLLRASIRDKRIEVDVGGQVQFIARGELED
jgi:trans-2,3-dihydro-3-hydroxyanthranilate isomerase